MHSFSFSGAVIGAYVTAFTVDSVQRLSYKNVLAWKSSRGNPWYLKNRCVNGATSLSSGIIWAWAVTTVKCAKTIKPSTSRRVHDQGPGSGVRERGSFQNFATVFIMSYPQLEVPQAAPATHQGRRMSTSGSVFTEEYLNANGNFATT